MVIHAFQNGDTLERQDRALIARFHGERRVLSTSVLNGGCRDNLQAAFNHDCKHNGVKNTPLKAPTYEAHLALIAEEFGLDAHFATGLSTAADMDNVAVISETYDDLTVTAAVTGGIDVNGGRVGDPADWHEGAGGCIPISGTINILLFIDANLPEGTLARALVTCTEAKTAALQELLAPSRYSTGIATGSGTDGTVIVSNAASSLVLTFAGKHSKLGELIGRSVMSAVKKALFLQTGLCPAQQFVVFARTERFGLTRARFLEKYPAINVLRLDTLSKSGELVVMTSLFVHLLDQLQWGLISPADAQAGAKKLLEGAWDPGTAGDGGVTDTQQRMIAAFEAALVTMSEK
ncbi:adenosylcobinamide amidohydrolase [Oscillospiraceae bacterium CM]|nr:adenosylcobinamide amidohydrolase [Oscillospiraceae bacterium CM]